MKLLATIVFIIISFYTSSHGRYLHQGPHTAESQPGISATPRPSAEATRPGVQASPLVVEGEDVYATVEQGMLRGAVVTSELGQQYASFRGVPYAEPPLGELRFQAPRPAASWNGRRDALQQAPACPQITGRVTSEDCLYLNVFVPLGAAAAPVLAWIPGGGFRVGTSEYEGPDFLVAEGVILVAFNYRLGALGFLSTGDEAAPGNAGLRDQMLALSWVQRNIAAFGGDPARVTVGGESAGGCSVGDLIISPAAAGLFQQATIISGEAVSPWGIVTDPRRRAFALGEALGLSTNDSQQLVDFLRTQDAADLVTHDGDVIPPEELIRLVAVAWGPVIDGTVIQEYPISSLKAGRFSRMPILVGYTSGDGMIGAQGKGYLSSEAAVQQLDENFVEAAAPLVRLPTADQRQDAALRIRDFYFGNESITLQEAQAIVDMLTDFGFVEPSDTAVRIMANQSDAAPIFYHLFDYRGPSIGNSTYGTPHGSQRSVLFSGLVTNPDEEFIQLRTNMVRLWANFVKYGTPSPEGESIEWTAFNNSDQNYMHITNIFEMKQNVYEQRMDFWHEIMPI
ncbi:acetylcholinesterase-like [Schistocerca serialis cubense]|uniref:acetylcholinesterase-like n=1 Tax=Schistocerca serialis cubense TaxID=2023355 RepID=UPI00214ED189|nr:acetylcholinesterase-like [Schistocerca serialis cubense]